MVAPWIINNCNSKIELYKIHNSQNRNDLYIYLYIRNKNLRNLDVLYFVACSLNCNEAKLNGFFN